MHGLRGRGSFAAVAALALLALVVSSAGASGPVLTETLLTPATGATVTKRTTWTVQVSGGAATRVELAVDGKVASRQSTSSKVTGVRTYGGVLDTRKLREGSHRLKVTTYGKGLSPVSTEATVTVDNVPDAVPEPPHQVAIPVVSGDALVGRTLTSSPGEWSGSQPMTFSYRWLRCNPDCAQIDGVDGPSYTVTGDDAGSTLRSRVTATNDAGSASESSAPTAVVPGPTPEVVPPHQVSIPVISGDALVGRTLTSSTGEWSGSQPMSFTYVWLRCHPDCTVVGDGPSYAVSAEDVGSTIRSRVTATNAAGSASESSAPTAVVTAGA
jgi:Bacterial Ig domain